MSGGITAHGLALNRDPDLESFRLMTACGAPGVEATSIAAEGGDPRRERVDGALAARSPSAWACGWSRPDLRRPGDGGGAGSSGASPAEGGAPVCRRARPGPGGAPAARKTAR